MPAVEDGQVGGAAAPRSSLMGALTCIETELGGQRRSGRRVAAEHREGVAARGQEMCDTGGKCRVWRSAASCVCSTGGSALIPHTPA